MAPRAIATPFLLAAGLAASAAAAAPFDVLDAVQSNVSLDGARAVAVSPDGAHVYACGFVSDTIAAFAVDGATGALTAAGFAEDGQSGVAGIAGCADVAVSPDGRHVYAAGFDADALGIFSRDAETGALTFVEALFDFSLEPSALDGPSGIVASPDGAFLYVTAGVGNTLSAFARDTDTGTLALADSILAAPPNELLAGPADLAMSPDGALVYVVSAGEVSADVFSDALLTFERNPVTGALTPLDAERHGVAGVAGLEFPNAAVASPDGRHVYTTAGISDAIAFFARDADDDTTSWLGLLGPENEGAEALDAPVGIDVTPDGGFVLAALLNTSALAVLQRDAATGALAVDRIVRDDADPERRMQGAIDVAVAPDGRFVYVAAFAEDALTVLAPEPGASATALAAGAALALRGRRARARRIVSPRT